MGLSLRLNSLLERCEPGLPLWDLCCDHGQLGLEALASGRFTKVFFNDAVAHVLEPLREVNGANVICALAEDIDEDLTGNIVLAGIGGEKIFKILSRHAERGTLLARRIVACPEKDAEWLAQQKIPGYAMVEQITITHNHGIRKIYTYSILN